MDIILKSDEISQIVDRCAQWICDLPLKGSGLALIGIRSKGIFLAQRVAGCLQKNCAKKIDIGTIDITLYRDDLDNPDKQPQLRSSEINFDITDKTIVLFDDVIHTGRTVRAAMDAILEFGRPAAIRLAVLIDRNSRELPIEPNFTGHKITVSDDMTVSVNFAESDNIDQVVVQ